MGSPGWSFADLLPVFRAIESDANVRGDWHGKTDRSRSAGPRPTSRRPARGRGQPDRPPAGGRRLPTTPGFPRPRFHVILTLRSRLAGPEGPPDLHLSPPSRSTAPRAPGGGVSGIVAGLLPVRSRGRYGCARLTRPIRHVAALQVTAGTGVSGDSDEQARAVTGVVAVAAAELSKRGAVRGGLTLAELTGIVSCWPRKMRRSPHERVPAVWLRCLQ
jgi:hypothetical protein